MISVIIPLYNKEPIIKKCLYSVLSQDYEFFEVIVVNDGSTDRSAEIVRDIKDSRLKLIDQPNSGPSAARNAGVKAANGDWIYFLDADDEMMQGALGYLGRQIIEYPDTDIFLCEACFEKQEGVFFPAKYNRGYVRNIFKAYFHGFLCQCMGCFLYKKQVCDKNPFNEILFRYEDYECLFRKYHNTKIYLLPFCIVKINFKYSKASEGRADIKEDFLGYLDFKNKSFWEKMCLYKLYLEERPNYPIQSKELYPSVFRHFDWLIIYKCINYLKKFKLYLNIIGLSQFTKK